MLEVLNTSLAVSSSNFELPADSYYGQSVINILQDLKLPLKFVS